MHNQYELLYADFLGRCFDPVHPERVEGKENIQYPGIKIIKINPSLSATHQINLWVSGTHQLIY